MAARALRRLTSARLTGCASSTGASAATRDGAGDAQPGSEQKQQGGDQAAVRPTAGLA
jgi:hypothetical protein